MAKFDFIHTFGPHYGGISEDDSLVRGDQVLYSENLDLTSNSKFANLSPKLSSYLTTPDKIVSMFYHDDTGTLMCDNDKNLYKNGNSTPVWNQEKVIKYWVARNYLYMLDVSEDIHRISLSELHNSNWGTYITRTESSLPTTSRSPHIISSEDITYIGYDKYLYVINNASGTIDATSTYEFIAGEIAGMSALGNSIRIYEKSGWLTLWEGIGHESYSERVNLNLPINYVYQVGSIDYIISNSGIYYVSGYTAEKIIYGSYSDELNSNKFEINRDSMSKGMSMEYLRGVFYIAGEITAKINDGTKTLDFGGLITMGNKSKGLPNALNVFMKRTRYNKKIIELHGVYIRRNTTSTTGDILYVAYKDEDGVYGVNYLDIGKENYFVNNELEGLIIYPTYNGGYEGAECDVKKLEHIEIRGDFKEDDEIDIMYIDPTSTGTNLLPLQDDLMGIKGPFKRHRASVDKEFYNLTLAVRLRQKKSGKKNSSIKFYHLKIYGNEIEQL